MAKPITLHNPSLDDLDGAFRRITSVRLSDGFMDRLDHLMTTSTPRGNVTTNSGDLGIPRVRFSWLRDVNGVTVRAIMLPSGKDFEDMLISDFE